MIVDTAASSSARSRRSCWPGRLRRLGARVRARCSATSSTPPSSCATRRTATRSASAATSPGSCSRFGLPLALASLMIMGLLNIDYVVIGAHARRRPARLLPAGLQPLLVAGEHVLGAGPARVAAAVRAAARRGDGRLGRPSCRSARCCCSSRCPACLVLAALAEPIVQHRLRRHLAAGGRRAAVADGARARARARRARLRLPGRARLFAVEPRRCRRSGSPRSSIALPIAARQGGIEARRDGARRRRRL